VDDRRAVPPHPLEADAGRRAQNSPIGPPFSRGQSASMNLVPPIRERSPMRRVPVVTVLVCCLALALASVGSASAAAKTTEVSAWAHVMCTSIGTWVQALGEGADALSGRVDTAQNVKEVKQILVDFLDNTVTRTDQLLNELHDAGNPSTTGGSQVAAAIVNGVSAARRTIADALKAARKLPTSNLTKFSQGEEKISKSLTKGESKAATAIGKGKAKASAALQDAMSNESACQSLS
jgi:hypothetical protein